jgi:hypothetical protein
MNMLLINHYAGSTHHDMEYRPYYLAREWVRVGHRVPILAASYSHVRTTHQPEMYEATRDETIDGIEYRWYRTPAYAGNGLGRVKNMLAFLQAIWRNPSDFGRYFWQAPSIYSFGRKKFGDCNSIHYNNLCKTALGKRISEKTGQVFPICYFLIAEKV